MKSEVKDFLTHAAIELLVYSALVLGYFFLVLHLLGGWLEHLFTHNRTLYSSVALGLIVGQGVALEVFTTALLRMIRALRGR